MNTDEIIEEILQELDRALEKFPGWPSDPIHAAAIIGEEYGELTKALVELLYEPDKGVSLDDVRIEALQLAATVIRFLRDLDNFEFIASDLRQYDD